MISNYRSLDTDHSMLPHIFRGGDMADDQYQSMLGICCQPRLGKDPFIWDFLEDLMFPALALSPDYSECHSPGNQTTAEPDSLSCTLCPGRISYE